MKYPLEVQAPRAPGRLEAWSAELAALMKLAAPVGLAHLAQMAIGLTDTLMLGRYGKTALAASVLGNTVYLFCWIVGLGPAAAVTPLIAQVKGARPRDCARTRAIVRMGLWSAGLVSPPLLLVLSLTRPILLRLGQTPELAQAAGQFVTPLALGLPFALAFQVLRNYAVALSRPQPTFYVMALVVLGNFVGDYLLIFGHFGAPRLGLVGSGIASACASLFGLLGMAAAVRLTPGLKGYRLLRRIWKPQWSRLGEILQLGLSISLRQILESGFYLCAHLLIGLFGPTYVAAHAIAWSVQNLTSLVPTGLGIAASVRVALAAGAGDGARVRRAGFGALLSTIALMAICGTLMAAFAGPIARVYVSPGPENAGVVAAAVIFLQVAAAYQVVDGLQAAAAFALQGLKDVRIPMWITAAGFWLVGLPACLALAFGFGLHALGVWIGLAIALTVSAALLSARLIRLMPP